MPQHPDYVCRVTADEGDIGRGHLSRFQDVETPAPVILTTSQLLTTGVDAPTCKNVVLARVINSMTEFKQIIGRGTRVRDDYGKLFFNILDYTGSATRLFADPDFDGDPVLMTEEEIDEDGETDDREHEDDPDADDGEAEPRGEPEHRRAARADERRKFYFDGGQVEIAAHLVYELDPDGKQLRVVKFTDYTAEKVRTLCPHRRRASRHAGPTPSKRAAIIEQLAERGIDFDELAEAAGQPDADPSTCSATSPSTRRCAPAASGPSACARSSKDFFEQYGPEARQILDELLDKYAEHGDRPVRDARCAARCRRSPSTATSIEIARLLRRRREAARAP